AIAADAAGNAYVTGQTASFDFAPGAGGIAGGIDAFGARFDATGHLTWATFFGGSLDDIGYGIAVDSSGRVYITGETASPTLAGGSPIPYAGGKDAFIAKIDPDARTIGYFSFLGGTGDDTGVGIAVDEHDNVYVAGYTTAAAAFPTRGATLPGSGG